MTSTFSDLNHLTNRPLTLDENNHHIYRSALDRLALIIPQINNNTYRSTEQITTETEYKRQLHTTFDCNLDTSSLQTILFQRNQPILLREHYSFSFGELRQMQSYLWFDDHNHVICLCYHESQSDSMWDSYCKYHLFFANTTEQLIIKLNNQLTGKYEYEFFSNIADELHDQKLDIMFDDLAKLINICEICADDNNYTCKCQADCTCKSTKSDCHHQITCQCDDYECCSGCVFGSSKGRRFRGLEKSFINLTLKNEQSEYSDWNLGEITVNTAITERNHPQLLSEYYESRDLNTDEDFYTQSQSYIWYTDDKIPVCLIYDDMSCEYHNYTNYELYSANTINEIIIKIEETMKNFGEHTKDCCIAKLKQLITRN